MKEQWFFVRGLVREQGHWEGFPEKFSAAFPEREVMMLDLLGNGVHYQEKSPLSVPELARALRADFLRSRKEGAKCFVVSVSLGAMVTLEWLRQFPDDISGAVLINTSLRGISPFNHRLLVRNYGTILKLFFSGDLLAREKEILRMTSNLPAAEQEKIAWRWATLQKKHPVSKGNAIRQILAAMRFRPSQEKPKAKILVLNSLGDRLVSPDCSEALSRHWAVELRRHPNAGHDLTLDAPEWALEQLKTI